MQDLRQQIEQAIQEVNNASGVTPKVVVESPKASPPPPAQREAPPAVPEVPLQFQSIPENAEASHKVPPKTEQNEEKGKEKAKHVTQGSDAPIFRAHPGTEVRIPSGSYIPSVILDAKVTANAF